VVNLVAHAARFALAYRNLFNLAVSMAGLALLAGVLLMANSVSLAVLDRRYDIGVLKAIVEERLLRHLDHRNLNLDVPWFADRLPSAENIAVVCWNELASALPAGRLVRIRLWETPRNYVDYTGD
jgi:hypothetical protein